MGTKAFLTKLWNSNPTRWAVKFGLEVAALTTGGRESSRRKYIQKQRLRGLL